MPNHDLFYGTNFVITNQLLATTVSYDDNGVNDFIKIIKKGKSIKRELFISLNDILMVFFWGRKSYRKKQYCYHYY